MSTARQVFRDEFQKDYLLFRKTNVENLSRCLWIRNPAEEPIRVGLFLTYRAAAALYVSIVLLYLTAANPFAGPAVGKQHLFLAYLTMWTYIVLCSYLVFGAIYSLAYYANTCARRQTGDRRSKQARVTSSEPRVAELTLSLSMYDKTTDPAFKEPLSNPENGVKDNASSGWDISQAEKGVASQKRDVKSSCEGNNNFSFVNDDGSNAAANETLSSTVTAEFKVKPDSAAATLTTTITSARIPTHLQLFWGLHNVALVASLYVSLVYFSVLYQYVYRGQPSGTLQFYDLAVHGLSSVFACLDVFLNAVPIRLLHVSWSAVYLIMYVLFATVYWAADKTENVIYTYLLDWNHPLPTLATLAGTVLVGLPLLQLYFFGMYQLKMYLARRWKFPY